MLNLTYLTLNFRIVDVFVFTTQISLRLGNVIKFNENLAVFSKVLGWTDMDT